MTILSPPSAARAPPRGDPPVTAGPQGRIGADVPGPVGGPLPRDRVLGGDDDVVGEQGGAPLAVLGGIVTEDQGDSRNRRPGLGRPQGPGEGAALEGLGESARVVGVDHGGADLDEVADLRDAAPRHQVRGVGGFARVAVGGAANGRQADPREQHRRQVLVRGEVHLNAVEPGLGKGQRGQGRADAVPDRDRVRILAVRVGVDGDRVEPAVEARILVDRGSELDGLVLVPVVDQPSPGQVVAVEVVERLAFDEDVDVALVGIAGVVGVFPLAVAVVDEQLLGDEPFLHCRVEGVEEHPRTARFVGDLSSPVAPQAPVPGLALENLGRQYSEQEKGAQTSPAR